jgi:hypothetical protein
MQPRHHLIDRRQLAGRTGFAARAGRARRAGLALRTGLATRALQTGFALRPRFAARTFQSGPSGMALRPGTPRLAARARRPLSSLPGDCVVCHTRTPCLSQRFHYQTFDDGINCAEAAGGIDQHQSKPAASV